MEEALHRNGQAGVGPRDTGLASFSGGSGEWLARRAHVVCWSSRAYTVHAPDGIFNGAAISWVGLTGEVLTQVGFLRPGAPYEGLIS